MAGVQRRKCEAKESKPVETEIMIMQGVRNRRNRLGLESCFGQVVFRVADRHPSAQLFSSYGCGGQQVALNITQSGGVLTPSCFHPIPNIQTLSSLINFPSKYPLTYPLFPFPFLMPSPKTIILCLDQPPKPCK